MPEPSAGARRAAEIEELRAARTAWHESFGVPISEEYARFLDAIGNLETRCGEMRKALEEISERDPCPDDCKICDRGPERQGCIGCVARNALNGGPQ